MQSICANAPKITLLSFSFLTVSLLSTYNASAYECLVAGGGSGGATSVSRQALGCGPLAKAEANGSTALGQYARSAGISSIAGGYASTSLGESSIAFGHSANSGGDFSISMGRSSHNSGDYSIALGESAISADENSIALGRSAYSTGHASTALGSFATASGDKSTAIGFYAHVDSTSNYGIAIGSDKDGDAYGARATADGAIALGNDVVNDVPDSMKIAVPLRIQGNTGIAGLLIEENHVDVAIRNLIKLKNNGSVGFQLDDADQNNQWVFRTGGGGSFIVSNIGTPGPMISLSSSGSVSMGHDSSSASTASNFILSGAGNLTIPHGTVTATAHISSSSRRVKTDFAKVNAADILSKIKTLDVTEWRYIDKNVKGRHIGPMAEDFYALFELGPDDKHVAATDMASIALIVAKELQKKADFASKEATLLRQENNILKSETELLKKRLASLEKLVTNLAFSTSNLAKKGDEVALK